MSKVIFGTLTSCALTMLFLPLPVRPADFTLLFAFLLKPSCDRFIPNYESENRANYTAWAREHQSELALVESQPDLVAKREEALKRNSDLDSLPPSERSKFEELCSDLADAFQSAAPADARFSSPEKTWALFRSSLQTGDRKTALLCLVDEVKRYFAEFATKATDQQLRQMADGIKELELPSTTATDRIEGSLITQNGLSGLIRFIRLGQNWKISDM